MWNCFEVKVAVYVVFFFSGKRYGWVDVLAAVCMSVGLILFTLADSKVTPNFHAKGKYYVCVCVCVC